MIIRPHLSNKTDLSNSNSGSRYPVSDDLTGFLRLIHEDGVAGAGKYPACPWNSRTSSTDARQSPGTNAATPESPGFRPCPRRSNPATATPRAAIAAAKASYRPICSVVPWATSRTAFTCSGCQITAGSPVPPAVPGAKLVSDGWCLMIHEKNFPTGRYDPLGV